MINSDSYVAVDLQRKVDYEPSLPIAYSAGWPDDESTTRVIDTLLW